ncbi:MAG: hypothetical protein JRJ45_00570 [Deltaproteobacteria bacterium]|nr:hypothetical protein [Deltaproteobacteria bacterium]
MIFDHNLGEVGFLLLGKKNMLLFGVGMVAEKIRTNPDWRMWATILGMVIGLLLPSGAFFAWAYDNLDERSVMRITPLQNQIKAMQHFHDSMDGLVDLKLEPVKVQIAHMLKFQDVGKRHTKDDAREDKVEIMRYIDENRGSIKTSIVECKDDNAADHLEINSRLRWLERGVLGNE